MDFYEIISVEIVAGNTLNPTWNSPMQKITTNQGVFIDNIPGKTFGKFPSGINWEQKIGNKVRANIKNSSNQKWILFVSDGEEIVKNVVESSDNLVTTSALAQSTGITTGALKQKLVDSGYLEVKDGDYVLTAKGKEVGGQPRRNQRGPYFMWPITLKL